jgi:glycosyltransferase involved in cell wall biosynthesis/GT2 family glycosyltransferase
MKIGIEMRQVTLGNAGGISQLLRGVLRCLIHRFPDNEYVFFSTIFNCGLLEPLPSAVQVVTLPLFSYFAAVPRLAREKRLDVLFRGYPSEQPLHDGTSKPLDYPMNKQIIQIPDIQHEYFPEFFDETTLHQRRQAFTHVLKEAGAIGTISNFARQTLLAQECCQCRDIFLMSPALQVEHQAKQLEPLTPAELEVLPSGDFFLFPANTWPHKNHRRVLQAFEKFLQKTRRKVEFIFTGHADGWGPYQREFGHLPIRHLGFVRAQVLRQLLENAKALVFFSLYEGFGMPLLEAFDAGTPVLCSNTTSLPEVGGNAVLSCDPTNVNAMSRMMERILKDQRLRRVLVRRGKERLAAYTWDEAAENLHDACIRVAQCNQMRSVDSLALDFQMTERPLVSIVTPSYNQGRYLQRTIESVLAQDYPHIEYIVMDGGSTDESLEILKSYGDGLRWVSERDTGQTNAINKGFAQCSGEILAYLNSDDMLLPGAVSAVVRYLDRRPVCDLLYGEARYIDEHDNITGNYNTADYSFDRLMHDCCICQPAAFWRTRIAKKIGAFDETLQYAMDYDYWIRIARAGGCIEHCEEFLACSRLHAATKTLSCRAKIYDEILQVCMRNTGSVSFNYIEGLWHHLCYEQSSRLGRCLRELPRCRQLIARLHHRWCNRQRLSPTQMLGAVAQLLKHKAKQKLKPLARLAQPITRFLTAASGRRLLGESSDQRMVTGVWADNWLASTCKVRLKDNALGQRVHLSGSAPQASELTVLCQGHAVGVYQLQPRQMVNICFELAPGNSREVVLKFTQHTFDDCGRNIAFQVQSTNLFTEEDMHA